MFRRHFIKLGLIATILFPLTGNTADLTPYRVGYNSWIGYISLFVGQEKGYFKDEGIDLQTRSFSSPGDGLTPLLAGQLDAAFTTADSVITVLDKAPGKFKIVYLTDSSAGADAILAKKEFKSMKDLKGKTVAATAGQCNELLLRKALSSVGMTTNDINMINMNPDDAGTAFAAGKLDAAVTWEPWISKVEGEKKGHVVFSSKQTPSLILDVVAISSKGEKEAATTAAFLRALNKANEFAIKHPKEAAKLSAKALEQTPEEVLGMLPKVNLYGKAANFEQVKTTAASSAKDLAKFFKEVKVNDTLVDTSDLYDMSYLK